MRNYVIGLYSEKELKSSKKDPIAVETPSDQKQAPPQAEKTETVENDEDYLDEPDLKLPEPKSDEPKKTKTNFAGSKK